MAYDTQYQVCIQLTASLLHCYLLANEIPMMEGKYGRTIQQDLLYTPHTLFTTCVVHPKSPFDDNFVESASAWAQNRAHQSWYALTYPGPTLRRATCWKYCAWFEHRALLLPDLFISEGFHGLKLQWALRIKWETIEYSFVVRLCPTHSIFGGHLFLI